MLEFTYCSKQQRRRTTKPEVEHSVQSPLENGIPHQGELPQLPEILSGS